jgi:hypothetical protein
MQEKKETRYLEILRTRFAGTDLDQCDVMLNDMFAWGRVKKLAQREEMVSEGSNTMVLGVLFCTYI